eukprot:2259704-Prorocentrum_lima.AAC.1
MSSGKIPHHFRQFSPAHSAKGVLGIEGHDHNLLAADVHPGLQDLVLCIRSARAGSEPTIAATLSRSARVVEVRKT